MLQAYELWAAGYSFFLLNNIFTSHWGFQKSSSRPSWRLKQTGFNSLKVVKFRQEVNARLFVSLDSNYTSHCRYQPAIIFREKVKEKAKFKLFNMFNIKEDQYRGWDVKECGIL